MNKLAYVLSGGVVLAALGISIATAVNAFRDDDPTSGVGAFAMIGVLKKAPRLPGHQVRGGGALFA